MRFAVDAHAVGQHLTGNETYIKNLLLCFDAMDRQAEFVAYVSRQSAADQLPSRFQKTCVSENPYLRLGLDLPRKLSEDRPELLHVQYTGPLFCNVPIVASVHDISFLEHPEYFTFARRTQLRVTVQRTVRRAARILAPSEFSKQRIIGAYPHSASKVEVVPIGVSPVFRPISREQARRAIQPIFPGDAPFILNVAELQPRKNHLILIRAFEELIRALPQLPHHLVIVGKESWYAHVIRAAAAKSSVADRIHFTGFVEDDALLRFYAACDCFIYPSLYEGFGLPVLEAMACGRAVACSSTSALPEVADSAALLFDPEAMPELVRALADLLLDAELRGRMERLGMQRATMFSWERTAAKTLDIYYEVAGKARTRRAAASAPATARRY